MEDKKATLNFDEISVTKSGYRHLDAVIYPDGSTSLKGLGKKPKEETTEEEKKGTINFDELAKENSSQQPRFKEEVRRNENGEITAYVMKRNK